MLQITFDSSVYIDASSVLQGISPTIIMRELCARILYYGHKKNYWQVTSNAGEKKNKSLDINDLVRGPWVLGVVGFSELGISTRLVNEDKERIFNRVTEIFGKINQDYALLIDHIDMGRDLFVSEDNDFFKGNKARLLKSGGVVILRSSEAVEHIVRNKLISLSQFNLLLKHTSEEYTAEINSSSRSEVEKEQALAELYQQIAGLETIQ